MSVRDEMITIMAQRLADQVTHGVLDLPWQGPRDRFVRVELDRDDYLLVYEAVLSNDDIARINERARLLIKEAVR